MGPPGRIICLIIPMSFVGGPYFAALRKRILKKASVLRLDPSISAAMSSSTSSTTSA